MSIKDIILDPGTFEIKYGFGNEKEPRVELSLVGKAPKKEKLLTIKPSKEPKQQYIGLDCQAHKDCNAKSPIVNRKVEDWEGLEKLLDHVFKNRLGIKTQDHYNVFLSVPVVTSSGEDQFKLMKMMFDKFKFDGIYIGDAASLALLAAGEKTGLVIDSGEELTHVVPIQDGEPITSNVFSLGMGGKDITTYLDKLLEEKKPAFRSKIKATGPMNQVFLKLLKETTCEVALDYEQELRSKTRSSCTERIQCTEPLFQPSLLKKSRGIGISGMAFAAIEKCDKGLRDKMYRTIVLAGGNCNISGMEDRVRQDLSDLQDKKQEVEPEFARLEVMDRSYAAWKGAAMMAQPKRSKASVITRKEYQEKGKLVMEKKH